MGVLDMGTRLPVELTHGATRSCGASGSRLLQQEAPWAPKRRPPRLLAERIDQHNVLDVTPRGGRALGFKSFTASSFW